jgi:hypothetical protein
MTMPAMWWTPPAVPEQSDQQCPCGARLKLPAEWAHGVCNRCRDHKPRRREPAPDFVDQPLPGLETWGQP